MMKKILVGLTIVFVFFSSLIYVEVNAQISSQKQTLLVGYDPDLPPFQFEVDGLPKGFFIDIITQIGNVEEFEVKFIAMSSKTAISELENGTIDIILNIHFLQQYSEFMEFSDPLYTSRVGIVANAENLTNIESIIDLAEKIVSIQRGTVEYEFMRNIRRIKYNVTSNQNNGIKLLLDGRSEAFVGDRLTAQYYLDLYGGADEFQFVGSNVLPIEYTMAIQKENFQLMSRLNRGLRTMKSDGSYSSIHQKWFLDTDETIMKRLLFITKLFAGLLSLSVILFLFGIRWNRQLQKLVSTKTKDLSEMNQSLEYQIQQTKSGYLFQKQILDSSPRGIVTCDNNGLITSFNSKAKKLSGITKDVMNCYYKEIPLLDFLLSKKLAQWQTKGKEEFVIEETFWTRADQQKLYFRYYIYPLYGFDNEVQGIILTFEDHTAERKLREQIFSQEKTKTLSRVVAGIAHEIRNPLTSIKTFVELIPKKINNLRFQQEIATYVPQEINRLNQLIEGLIDYARPQSTNKEIIDAAKVVQECLILFESTITNKEISLESFIDDNLWIEVDRNQLKQVIINLIINGVDAMEIKNERQLSLIIKAQHDVNHVYIEVTDQGIGMEKEEIEQIFEPFYTTKPKGSGLGLAISEQFVIENNGSLQVNSLKGEGTSMILIFERKVVENG
ncbi:transporter substrate-binding domain-containing protein [Bacillaceae bacterium IKA-2]|nr:transporter substrate-binding domain-containing protein [Bacillaceae bacterium IKA-2]